MRWTRFQESDAHPERGSEVVSTVLVQGLVVLVILLLAQIAFASHVRTMSVSAASEGARRGGLLGGDEDEARARTGELLDSLVGGPKDREIDVGREDDGGVDVEVSVRVPLPFVPAWLGSAGVGVSSSARVPVREVVAHG